MSTFGPDPEHRFAFGLRTHRAPASEPVEPWEFVYRLGDIGAWGVGFHDDDLVPVGASSSERHDILDKVAKALDSTGMVVSISSANLSGHPVFANGAFTSADRDVRRYAIQKAMRAIDLGAELGAGLHELLDRSERVDRGEASAERPRPLPRGGRLPVRVRRRAGHDAARFAAVRDDCSGTHWRSSARSSVPRWSGSARRSVTASGAWCHGVVQAIEAGKLFHLRLDPQPAGDDFLLVKMLEESGYDGPLHIDIDPACFDDATEMWDFTAGCMRTYRALAAKARRFADDPEIRDALAVCGALELAEPSVGSFSPDARRVLSMERFDLSELVQRQYSDQRLDQLVIDLVLGLR